MTEAPAAPTAVERDHAAGWHTGDWRPSYCPTCWPNGAPEGWGTPPPSVRVEDLPRSRTRERGEGFEGLGAALARLRERIVTDQPDGDVELAPDGGPGCAVCNGARFTRRDVPIDDPDFGRALPCRESACVTWMQRRQLERFERAVPDDARTASLEAPAGPHPEQQNAAEMVRSWCTWSGFWLYLWGPPGRGKTWLAVAGARALGLPPAFVKVSDLLGEIAATYDRDTRARDEMRELDVIERYKRVRVLVLDELGVEAPTAWAEQRIYQVLDARASDREAVTLITSNLSPERLEARLARVDAENGERLVSRILGRTGPFVVPIGAEAPDLRLWPMLRSNIREVFST